MSREDIFAVAFLSLFFGPLIIYFWAIALRKAWMALTGKESDDDR